jgi:large conductance mechanosensitive channel
MPPTNRRRVGIDLPDPPEVLKKPVGWISEFREFIARGNVIDLAVGVIIGAAFNDIVKALVDNVIMPPIGLMLSGIDFSHLQWVLKADNPATEANELVAIQYGAFINTMIKFVIVAWAVFLLVKMINVIRRREAERGPPETKAAPPQEVLLTEIRDLLKAQVEAQATRKKA